MPEQLIPYHLSSECLRDTGNQKKAAHREYFRHLFRPRAEKICPNRLTEGDRSGAGPRSLKTTADLGID